MEVAMHAARLVAAQSALLALLVEQEGEQLRVDGVTVTLSMHHGAGTSMDVAYTANGMPVGGEGV